MNVVNYCWIATGSKGLLTAAERTQLAELRGAEPLARPAPRRSELLLTLVNTLADPSGIRQSSPWTTHYEQ